MGEDASRGRMVAMTQREATEVDVGDGNRMGMVFDFKSPRRLIPIKREDWGCQACVLTVSRTVRIPSCASALVAHLAWCRRHFGGRISGATLWPMFHLAPLVLLFYLLLYADDALVMAGGIAGQGLQGVATELLFSLLYVGLLGLPQDRGWSFGGVDRLLDRPERWMRESIGFPVSLWLSRTQEQGGAVGREWKAALVLWVCCWGRSGDPPIPSPSPSLCVGVKAGAGRFSPGPFAMMLALVGLPGRQATKSSRRSSPRPPPAVGGELFRADAAADRDSVVVGGWETCRAANPKRGQVHHGCSERGPRAESWLR